MKKTNVLLILADQLNYSFLPQHSEDKPELKGFHALLSSGKKFYQSYSCYPLCCPARTSLFTGLRPETHGVLNNHFPPEFNSLERHAVSEERSTLGQSFADAGYDCGYFGKEHASGYGWVGANDTGSLTYNGGGYLAEGSVFDQIFTKDAVGFLQKDRTSPFYATVSYINPHDICKTLGPPISGKNIGDALFFCRNENEKYLRKQERPPLPHNFDDIDLQGIHNPKDTMYEELPLWSENDWQRYLAVYSLLIENLDWQIQILLQTLKDTGQDENTLICFTTDHGDMMGSHQLIAKTVFYEESVKTPFILSWPEHIKADTTEKDNFISTIDVMPTLLDLAGVPVPSDLDGISLKKICLEETGEVIQDEVRAVNSYAKMLRFSHYKYVRSTINGEDHEVLIDLEKDPKESLNFVEDKCYQGALQEARRRFISHS